MTRKIQGITNKTINNTNKLDTLVLYYNDLATIHADRIEKRLLLTKKVSDATQGRIVVNLPSEMPLKLMHTLRPLLICSTEEAYFQYINQNNLRSLLYWGIQGEEGSYSFICEYYSNFRESYPFGKLLPLYMDLYLIYDNPRNYNELRKNP